MLAGNDDAFLRTLELGGAGGILVASHIVGREMQGAVRGANRRGRLARPRARRRSLEPIYRALTVTSNPTPVKAALEMLGIIEAHMRLPMVPASPRERDAIGQRSSSRDCSSPAARLVSLSLRSGRRRR